VHEAELNKKFHLGFFQKQRDILHNIQTPLLPANQSRPCFEVVNITPSPPPQKKKTLKRKKFLFLVLGDFRRFKF